jgi:signal transduction histidine kinase
VVAMLLLSMVDPVLAILNAVTIPLTVPRGKQRQWMACVLLALMLSCALNLWVNSPGLSTETRATQQQIVAIATLGYVETLTWALFGFLTAKLIVQTEDDRRRLAALNAELETSRAMLAEAARVTERLEIARELHDSLGHHLTTLNLELEIANHCPPENRQQQVAKAQFMARLLLADLRDMVTSWRRELTGGLPEALRCLAEGVSTVPVHLTVDPALPSITPARAHALLRCAQEGLTNALRHASATAIWIEARATETGEIELTVRDNGQGGAALSAGNGLKGMAARAEEEGGKADFGTAAAGGFQVRVRMPAGGGAA